MDRDSTKVATPAPPSDRDVEPDALPRGTTLGRYVILNRVGSGAMGVVYAAFDPDLDRKVALKVVYARGGRAESSSGRARLVREAQALAKLSDPHVVGVYDVGTVDEQVWIAMEFVAGQTLRAWLSEKPRGWTEILLVLSDAARGVSAAHKVGLVHRDLKPDNVMIGSDGRVRVMDFGLAHGRALSTTDLELASTLASDTQARPEIAALGLHLTQTGAVQGTPAYMAPEQWRGKEAGPAADQFSWGVMAWEMLHGQLPFEGETMLTVAAAVLSGKHRPPPRGSDVPSWLTKILDRALSVEPEGRWATVERLLAVVEQTRRRVRFWKFSIAIAALILPIASAVYLTWLVLRSDDRDQPVMPPNMGKTLHTSSIALRVEPADLHLQLIQACDDYDQDPLGIWRNRCAPIPVPGGELRMITLLEPGTYRFEGIDSDGYPFHHPIKVAKTDQLVTVYAPTRYYAYDMGILRECGGPISLDAHDTVPKDGECVAYWRLHGARDYQTVTMTRMGTHDFVTKIQHENHLDAPLDYIVACFDAHERVLRSWGTNEAPLSSTVKCTRKDRRRSPR